ncbi:MAG: ChbG/HpnK family deacetylase [Proteobacteria bacterium]|nr:ChbG/HpnK family deacetylase [Pseudomonadota bacterium]
MRATSGKPRLIVTADDFGRDPEATTAIAAALQRGQITSASIMANGACFDQACDEVRRRGLAERIGVHVALDEGPALSPEMRAFTDSDGLLRVRRQLRPFPGAFGRAVEAECMAQVQKVVDAGIRPRHLDSHRHIHTAFPIGRLLVRTARRFGIAYVRPARNLVSRQSWRNGLYKRLFNAYLRSQVGTADYFGDVEDFVARPQPLPAGSLTELMVHLDGSERGRSGQALLASERYTAFLRGFDLCSHEPKAP